MKILTHINWNMFYFRNHKIVTDSTNLHKKHIFVTTSLYIICIMVVIQNNNGGLLPVFGVKSCADMPACTGFRDLIHYHVAR